MTRQLTTQNATITTAAVEVKTLTISGKQVTLAVFRQLQEEPLIAQDGTLNGEPWGVVNYHPDKCSDAPAHLHVVWQHDGELRRSAVQMPADGRHSHPAADLYVQARIIYGTVHRPRTQPKAGDSLILNEKVAGVWRTFAKGRFKHDGMDFEGAVPDRLRREWSRYEGTTPDEDRLAFERALAAFGISHTEPEEQATAKLLAALPTEQYRATVSYLSTLPQLFIAV
ncbi:hypothetical protein [Streptomyces sp. 020-2-3H-GM]|uniref:hypothetical protein n=1 Tax=Streptomyces sp. 020-2-3H-GM TaxID=2789258 RepID=UPI003980E23C